MFFLNIEGEFCKNITQVIKVKIIDESGILAITAIVMIKGEGVVLEFECEIG